MDVIDDAHRGRLDRRMAGERRAHELAVERPPVFRIGRRVDPDEAVAVPDVSLEGGLLGLSEHVARRQEEDDRVVRGERGVREGRGVLGGVHFETALRAEKSHGGDGIGDRRVAEARGLREHEDARAARGRFGPGRAITRGAERRREKQHQERAAIHRPFKYSPSGQSSETG